MRRVATASAVLAATLLLGACTGADPAPNYSSVSPTPSAPTTSAKRTPTPMNTRPGESSPTPLGDITIDNAEGAAAFATYYIQNLDWVVATGDVDLLSPFYADDCTTCEQRVDYLKDAFSDGAYVTGGRLTIIKQAVVTNDSRLRADEAVSTQFSIGSSVVRDASGGTQSPQPTVSAYTLTTWLRYDDDGWKIVEERHA